MGAIDLVDSIREQCDSSVELYFSLEDATGDNQGLTLASDSFFKLTH